MDLRYTLTDSKKYEVNENKKQLLFEINDGNTTYEQIVEFEGEKGLVVGKNQQRKIEFTGPNISRVLYNGYKLNVYEYHNGHKKNCLPIKITAGSMCPKITTTIIQIPRGINFEQG